MDNDYNKLIEENDELKKTKLIEKNKLVNEINELKRKNNDLKKKKKNKNQELQSIIKTYKNNEIHINS